VTERRVTAPDVSSSVLGVLDHPSDGLAELRGVLMREHVAS